VELKLIPVSQTVFGTDFAFRTSEDHVKELYEYGFNARDLSAIERENTLMLLSRLRTWLPPTGMTGEARET
jgi:hypothetical protein